MAVVDEIAVKLGVEAGDLKAALADANASVKQFGANGQHGAEGFSGALHETHASVKQLHQFFVAGGIVEVVKSFFEMAITGAEKMGETTDENAKAVLRFRDGIKETHGLVTAFAVDTVGFFNRVGESIGTSVRYAKEFWEAQLTGNRANIAAFDEAEKGELAANEAAERFAKLKKEHGEELKKLAEEIKAETAKQTDELEKQKPAIEQIADRTGDIAKQQAIIADAETGAVDRQKARLQLIKDEGALSILYAEQTKQSRTESIAANKAALEVQLQGLDTQQKIALLTTDVKVTELGISLAKKSGADTTVLQANLDAQRLLLAKAQGEQEKAALDRKRKIAGSAQEELELLLLQHKAVLGIATGPEALMIKQIEKQRELREVEIDELKIAQEVIDGKLTPAQEKQLAVLEKQKTKLDESLAALGAILALPATPAPPVAATLAAVEKLNAEWDGFTSKITQQGNVQNLSDTQLGALVLKLQSQLAYDQAHPSGSDFANQVGLSLDQQNLANAVKEQNARADFRRTVGAFGQGYAEATYAPADFNRLVQYLNPDQAKKQADNIQSITTTLTNLFPKQAQNIRG